MQITPISRRFKAKALTNPFPSYVSLVKAGANQRPIRAIKMDGFEAEETDMKIQRADAKIAAIVTTGFDIVSLKFDGEKFADEAAVKAWLDEGGYSDYEIVATKSGFEVVNDAARVETGTARKVQADEGVSAFVAKTHAVQESGAAATNDASAGANVESAEPTAKADETSEAAEGDENKESLGGALLSSPGHTVVVEDEDAAVARALADSGLSQEDWDKLSETVREESIGKARAKIAEEAAAAALAEGEGTVDETEAGTEQPAATAKGDEDGVVGDEAPGENDEINPDADLIARVETMIEKLTAKGVEFTAKKMPMYAMGYIADAVCSLRYLIEDSEWNGISEELVGKLKDAARTALEAFLIAASEVADSYSEVLKSGESATEAPAEVTPEAPEAPAVDMAALAEMIGSTVKEAITPVQEAMAGVQSRVEEVAQAVETTKADLNTRVDELSQRGQTRKGAVTPTTNEGSPSAEPAATPKVSRSMLSAYGSRHGRGED